MPMHWRNKFLNVEFGNYNFVFLPLTLKKCISLSRFQFLRYVTLRNVCCSISRSGCHLGDIVRWCNVVGSQGYDVYRGCLASD